MSRTRAGRTTSACGWPRWALPRARPGPVRSRRRDTVTGACTESPTRKATHMHVPESLRVLIRAKLAAGRLPHDHLRVSGGPGNGETCVACGEAITTSNLVMRGVSRGLQT